MHLEIKQNINKTEIVDPSVISKLYELSYEDLLNGIVSLLDSTSDVQGRIETIAADEDEVRYLAGIDPGDVKRFLNLYITVPDNSYYINIEDPSVKTICVALFGGADGGTAATNTRVNNTKIPGAAGELTYRQAASITSFPYGAFRGNNSIVDTSVFQYFTNLTNFGGNAFENCSSLENITIPANFTTFLNNSFIGCDLLTRVDALKDLEGWLRIGTQNINSTPLMRPVSLYLNGVKLEGEITIPNSITTINGFAFYNLRAITGVVFHNGITSIGGYAFANSGITGHIILPTLLTVLNECTFLSCNGITAVTIPNGVVEIKGACFESCSSLSRVYIPSSVIRMREKSFYIDNESNSIEIYYDGTIEEWMNIERDFGSNLTCVYKNNVLYIQGTAITNLVIPAGITVIKLLTFCFNKNIKSVTIPDTVTTIGASAFLNTSITSITIPNSVTTIQNHAFFGCVNASSITIGNSVASIGLYAFYSCLLFTSVTIPNSVTSIGGFAFANCSNLGIVIVEAATPPTLGNGWVFSGNKSGRKIYVPDASVDTYKAAQNWSNFKDSIKGISELS